MNTEYLNYNMPQTGVTSYATIIITYFEIIDLRERHGKVNKTRLIQGQSNTDSIYLYLSPKIQKLCLIEGLDHVQSRKILGKNFG